MLGNVSKKYANQYNEIFRNIFHLLDFDDTKRELCRELTKQCVKEIVRAKKNKIDYRKVTHG